MFLLAFAGFCSIGGREMAPQTGRTPAQNALWVRKKKNSEKKEQSNKAQSDVKPSTFILLYSVFILFLFYVYFISCAAKLRSGHNLRRGENRCDFYNIIKSEWISNRSRWHYQSTAALFTKRQFCMQSILSDLMYSHLHPVDFTPPHL